jgi:hypothetical protein
MKKEVLVMLRKYELPARSRLKLIGGALEMIESYAEPQLSKKEQGKVIDRALAMLEKVCPDWAAYAEPRENFAKNDAEIEAALSPKQ